MEMKICFLVALICCLSPAAFVQGQNTLGFISLDCGLSEESGYTDEDTGLDFRSDSAYVDSGISRSVPQNYRDSVKQFWNLRSFPGSNGTRNCYTIRDTQGSGSRYLIRARFMYGNYDGLNQLPQFDLHIGVDYWTTMKFNQNGDLMRTEIIHNLQSDNLQVCLINTGFGTPFISSLELRPLTNLIYNTTFGSLVYFARWDLGSSSSSLIRYKEDLYDRIWRNFTTYSANQVLTLSTANSSFSQNLFTPPAIVMMTAIAPRSSNDGIAFYWDTESPSSQYYIYLHFAEIEQLASNQSREINIYLNGDLWYGPFRPEYLSTNTIHSTSPLDLAARYRISVNKTGNSTLPPILNAYEIYSVRNISNATTYQSDVVVLLNVKTTYRLTKNWQGDPCLPQAYTWLGINCSYDNSGSPRIISLNLGSSGLNGTIAPSISNLTMLQSLNLSNNNLTGEVPKFLASMPFLGSLDLKGNNFTGTIPSELLQKAKNGTLSLSYDGPDVNESPCQNCGKKNKIVVPVVSSIAAFLAILILLALLWWIRRKKQVTKQDGDESIANDNRLPESKTQHFTFSQILSITRNFNKVIGKGGFGTVYHGHIGNVQVAVKVLSPSSSQGYKEFQAEANLLMNVHHKNLTGLIGYCNEGTKMAIIYEYMANGSLDTHLSEETPNVLSWEVRLQIARDAAEGLEYLHHGCKPAIIHRDVKTTNILLDAKFCAKFSDFGLSRAFLIEGETHVTTVVAGTPGYLDPEYYTSNRLTDKSDVYSFGVVLLEIITGLPAIVKLHKTHIISWVSSKLESGDITEIVDPRLQGNFDINSAWRAAELAMACVSQNSTRRPSMNHVVSELKWCLSANRTSHEVDSKDSIGLLSTVLDSGLSPSAR